MNVSAHDENERNWAAAAHGSALLNLVVPGIRRNCWRPVYLVDPKRKIRLGRVPQQTGAGLSNCPVYHFIGGGRWKLDIGFHYQLRHDWVWHPDRRAGHDADFTTGDSNQPGRDGILTLRSLPGLSKPGFPLPLGRQLGQTAWITWTDLLENPFPTRVTFPEWILNKNGIFGSSP